MPPPQTPPPIVPPPQQPPAAPPQNDVDVNQMIASIEAETKKQETALREQIMGEAEKVFTDKMAVQKEQSDKVMADMKGQLDALTKASEEQKRTVIEDYKVKLAEQTQQISAIEGELSQRQTNVPPQTNPYRKQPGETSPNGETLDPESQKKELAKMYNAVGGRKL